MNKIKRYHVITSKANIPALNHYNIRNLKIKDSQIEFITDAESFAKIKDSMEIEYTDLTSSKLRNIIRKHLITIIGTILISLALINQSVSVSEVRFTNPDTYDEDVLIYMDKYYNKVGPFRYLNANLTEINLDLRSTFYQYEWIGISKKGAIVYLDIKKIVNEPIKEETEHGSYYASCDGIIKRYHIEKGVVVVQEEQFVAKGQLLISGYVTHYNNEIESVRAKGYVIAEVLQYKDYTVPKKTSKIERTGKMEIQKDFYLFGKKIGKETTQFQNYDDETGKITNILNFIKIEKKYRYEKKEIKKTYTSEQAVRYAQSLVYKEFRSNKLNEFEKIIFNNLVRIEEDDNYYYIRLIVKSYQNIALFVPEQNIDNQ